MSDMSHVASPRKPAEQALFDAADGQGGYFTTAQAKACGYSRSLLGYHVGRGRFERYKRGLYRIARYPWGTREDVLRAWLAAGKTSAVVSHESALDLLGISDIVPAAIHLTVPRTRRGVRAEPWVRIHTVAEPIPPQDLRMVDGMVTTSAARTIIDVAHDDLYDEQLQAAIVDALHLGMVTDDQLMAKARAHGPKALARVRSALDWIASRD